MNKQQTLAADFKALHQRSGKPLLLSNAWDAGSARLIESLGAEAVATTSAGVAWALGYADGNRMPLDELAGAVRRMARVINVPLSVDIEAGYSDDPAQVAVVAREMIAAGAVGINLEDGSGSADLLVEKLRAVRAVAAETGVDLFINARTDLYLRPLVPAEERLAEALRRSGLYAAAGADSIFAPGITNAEEIGKLVSGAPVPVAVMARPVLPSLPELAALGVRRLSAGSALPEALFEITRQRSREFLSSGNSAAMTAGLMPYGEINALFL